MLKIEKKTLGITYHFWERIFHLKGFLSLFCVFPQTGSSSSGTTTTGADISTTIPSEDWAKTLGGEIGIAITAPAKNYPLFFIDSEGMGIRQVSCTLKMVPKRRMFLNRN